MELRHLRYFVAVAEEQNVTRAAARLHVSQPPLSRQIRALEDELGFALFEHNAKSVKLTEAGQVFLTKVRDVLKQTEDAVQAARAVATGQHGEIHIGYAPSLAADILPDALRLFQKENSGVRIQLHDMSSEEMARELHRGRLHLAYMVNLSKKIMSQFRFLELRRFAVCIGVEPGHRLAKGRKVSLQDVAAEPLLAFTETDYPEYHLWVSQLFAPLKRAPQIREEHDSVSSLVASIEAGRGVAIVPAPFKSFSPRIKVREIVPPPPTVPFGLACVKGTRSELVSRFFSAAERTAGKA